MQVNGPAGLRLMVFWREGSLAPGSCSEWRALGRAAGVFCASRLQGTLQVTSQDTPKLLGCSGSAGIPSNRGRAEGGVTMHCLLLSTSLQKGLKSEVPSAHTALAHSWDGKQAPCQEPGFAGSRAFHRSSHCSCHNPAGLLGPNATSSSNHSPAWEISGCLG